MADSKQNSETENKTNTGENKTSGNSGASAQQAKDNSPASNKTGSQNMPSVGNVTDAAKDTLNQVKESVGTLAGDAVGQAKEKASSVLDEQKSNLASGVASVADSIRQVGENLSDSNEDNQIAALAGKYGDNLAAQIEKFSSYIDEKEIRELVTDVEKFAKRNPILFVSGAFGLGILAARFLKSSGRKKSAKRS